MLKLRKLYGNKAFRSSNELEEREHVINKLHGTCISLVYADFVISSSDLDDDRVGGFELRRKHRTSTSETIAKTRNQLRQINLLLKQYPYDHSDRSQGKIHKS